MPTMSDLTTPIFPNWCPGCGNFAIWSAFKNACISQGWDNTNTALVAGIGCHGHFVNFVKLTSFEGLHGRALPVATGIKMANHRLNVFVFTGDGDSLGEGGNHFMHTCRRNHDITVIMHDNGLYALTTGQTSPASPHGFKSKSTPEGNHDMSAIPISLAIAGGAGFVARAYAGDIPKTQQIIIEAANHKGMSFVDILQPCVTFNKEYTHNFYQENTYYLGQEHDSSNKIMAYERSLEWGPKKIALGVFYKSDAPSYESQLPQLSDKVLIDHSLIRSDLDDLFKKFV